MVCHHPDKFCDHRHYGSGVIMFLICQLSSSKHMFKGLSEITGGSLLRPVTTLPYLVPIGQVQLKISGI